MNDTTKSNIQTLERFIITSAAAKRISQLMDMEENKKVRLRISVLSGGCSGFQYNYDFDPNKNNDDIIFEKNGIEVLIDELSLGFIEGSQLDFLENLGGSSFEIKNPNATANCGCGNSFSV